MNCFQQHASWKNKELTLQERDLKYKKNMNSIGDVFIALNNWSILPDPFYYIVCLEVENTLSVHHLFSGFCKFISPPLVCHIFGI